MRLLLALTLFLIAAPTWAQRALTHDDYPEWSRIDGEQISADGNWATWTQQSYERDATLYVRPTDGSAEWAFARGTDAAFSDDARFLAFVIEPPRDSTRQAKLDGKKGDKLPQDSLAVLTLATGELFKAPNLRSMRLPADGSGWMAYLIPTPKAEPDTTDADEPDESEAEASERPAAEPTPAEEKLEERRDKKTEGHTLVVRMLESGEEMRFDHVADYRFSDNGEWLAFTTTSKDGTRDGVYALRNGQSAPVAVMEGEGHYRQLALDETGRHLAFVSDAATFTAEYPAFTVYTARLGEAATARVAAGHDALPAGWQPSEHGDLSFSDSGARLFFGTAPAPEPYDEPELTDDEKVTVDVWHWQDAELQPMQLLRASSERTRSYRAVLMLATGEVAQLADETVPSVEVSGQGDGSMALGVTNQPYRMESSWEFPGFSDVYLIDVATGERRQVLTRVQARPDLSPGGRWLAWWDADRQAWMTLSTEPGARSTAAMSGASLANREHDWAYKPQSYGMAGWTAGDEALLIYDEFDLLSVDPTRARTPINLTDSDGPGRLDRVRYRVIDPDPDDPYVQPDALLSAFDEDDKSAGFYRLVPGRAPVQLAMQPVDFSTPRKAERDARMLLTRSDFRTFPDLHVASADLSDLTRLSDANPQIGDYTWGTAEQFGWTSVDGNRLEGTLYKPDGFDPNRTYPLMVYFYERLSDNLHRWHQPEPGRSVISIPFYVSRGYAVFVPDIPYEVGFPGRSAMNAVMPGVTKLMENDWVDADRIGVQGHSWGGYQIAYMITQTDLFAAAGAGAPVANMTSAYGGIRWGSGMSRMFQYERTQSRIGGTLWEKPMHYLANSPVFHADKITTPLLMMHNDEDGAVPWEQGIEMFVAMRRLGKPAWMVNYNGDPHWAMGAAHRLDYAVRMQQFFDHYLMDAPAPVWMTRGVPAVDKGRTFGLEIESETVATDER
jgi:dipeptidyl aminopeptidase/acylaminoacyl peptidase